MGLKGMYAYARKNIPGAVKNVTLDGICSMIRAAKEYFNLSFIDLAHF
jgi:hypothetical protein